MDASKQFLKDNDITARISFKGTGPHTITLAKDKADTLIGTDGKEVNGVQYLVKEDGEPKTFFTSSIPLVQKLAEYKPGDTVTVEMKSVKGTDGGFKSTFVVSGAKEDDTPEFSKKEKEEKKSDTPEEEIDIEDIPFG